mmetsp:Transcript_9531/g.41727  ORF Transcript_9531/g.41727 Transcript_9531/m.41727 type:complete len:462 (-) Transcript_9531:1320-2705(-)
MPEVRGPRRGDFAREGAQPTDPRGAGHAPRSPGDAPAAGDVPASRQLRRGARSRGARREISGAARGRRSRRRRARGGVQAIVAGDAQATPHQAQGRHPAPRVPPHRGLPPADERARRGGTQAHVPAMSRGPRRRRRRRPRRRQRVRVPQATHRSAQGAPLRRRHAVPRHLRRGRGWRRGRQRRGRRGRRGCRRRAPVRLERAQGRRVPRAGGEDAAANRRGRRARVRDGALRILRRLARARRAGFSADASAPLRGRRARYLHARDGRRGGGVRADGGDAQVGDGAFVRGGEGQGAGSRRRRRRRRRGAPLRVTRARPRRRAHERDPRRAERPQALRAAAAEAAVGGRAEGVRRAMRARVDAGGGASIRTGPRRGGPGRWNPRGVHGGVQGAGGGGGAVPGGVLRAGVQGWREAGGRSGRGGGAEEFHRLSRASGFGVTFINRGEGVATRGRRATSTDILAS